MLGFPKQITFCLLLLKVSTLAQENTFSDYTAASSNSTVGRSFLESYDSKSRVGFLGSSNYETEIGGERRRLDTHGFDTHDPRIGNENDKFPNGHFPSSTANFNRRGHHHNRQHFTSSVHQNNRGSELGPRPNQQHSLPGQHNNYRDYGHHVTSSPGQGDSQKDNGREVCYDLLGCFKMTEPWKSALRPVPAPLAPENNSAVLYFYSRPNVQQRYLINLYPEYSLGDAKFDRRKPTVAIIHGFMQDGNEEWMEEMKNGYLKHVDANVLLVNWGKGANRLSYLQVTGNTRLIARMVANFIKSLVRSHMAQPRKFHLIGHSLGAQIASYIAKEVPGIGRLTALDPAQPGFEGFDKAVRLDKSDAEFVDVVHTNGKPFIPNLGLGMIAPHGHVDFYVNGGFDQPLCVSPPPVDIKKITNLNDLGDLPFEYISRTFICDHNRAYAYFVEALNEESCIFWGHKATAKNVIQTALNTVTQGLLSKYVAISEKCTVKDCIPMGFATRESPLRGIFVVTTNGKSPYCKPERRIN